MSGAQRLIEGYSRVSRFRVKASTLRPERRKEVLQLAKAGAFIARGAGHSYGDAALPTQSGQIVLTQRMDKFLNFNPQAQEIRCEAGVLLRDVFNVTIPHGLYLPVTPGTSEISIGGCIAADIHSKNHWRAGGFSQSVVALTVLTSELGVVECSRDVNPDLFFATLSGYGLTGIILEATLKLEKIPSTQLDSCATFAKGAQDIFAAYVAATEKHAYAVAWVDYLNGKTPRGVILSADFAKDGNVAFQAWQDFKKKPLQWIAPFFNALSQSVFNHVFYAKHRAQPATRSDLRPFLFPWDSMTNFNLLYGKNGFYEYQCCVPEESAPAFFAMLSQKIAQKRSAVPVYFAAFKRMGNCEGMMSYPMKGYSFLLDVKVTPQADAFLDELDAFVCEYNGRVNIAKDARLSAARCKQMYAHTDAFLAVVAKYNKAGLRASAMAERFKWGA